MEPMSEPRFDPRPLSRAQRHGDACVVCGKRWPRPPVRVGRVPEGAGVFACHECARALPLPRRATGSGKTATPAGGPVLEPASAKAADHAWTAVLEVSPGRG